MAEGATGRLGVEFLGMAAYYYEDALAAKEGLDQSKQVEFGWTCVQYTLAKTVMLKYLHSPNKNTLHFTEGNAKWASVNDGSYHFLFKDQEEAEWFHTGKQVPPICIPGSLRSSNERQVSAQLSSVHVLRPGRCV